MNILFYISIEMLSTVFEDNKLYIVENEEDGKHYFEAIKLVNDILYFVPTAKVNIFDDKESIVCRNIGLDIPMQCYATVSLTANDAKMIQSLLKYSIDVCDSTNTEINETDDSYEIQLTDMNEFLIQQLMRLIVEYELKDGKLIIKNKSKYVRDILRKMF